MKLMKLGTRPDIFFTSGPVRSVHTEVASDLEILVEHVLFRLHKFPLLSKCLLLQSLCAESSSGGGCSAVELPDFPGGAEAFEACAKFCYGVTVTVGAHNVAPLRCAAGRLGMTEAAERGNLAAKLDAFLASCLLRRWKDALAVLRSTSRHAAACEELGVTSRCADAVAALLVAGDPASASTTAPAVAGSSASPWWVRDVSDLDVDLFWRVMVAVKAAGTVKGTAVGDALKAYARRWLPSVSNNVYLAEQTDDGDSNAELITGNHRLLVEKMVSLLPAERNAVSCSFLLKLLKAANILGASPATKAELTRRAALQLEDANVSDLLIPSSSASSATETPYYDVDAVAAILEEFAMRQAAAAGSASEAMSPAAVALQTPEVPVRRELGVRRRAAVDVGCGGVARRDGQDREAGRWVLGGGGQGRQLAAGQDDRHGRGRAGLRPPVHDDLYRAVDTTSGASGDGQELEEEAVQGAQLQEALRDGVHARRQNEMLPLRVVVQVLFFENARAAAAT
ncbi:hypothetical protein EJB05_39123, partial [Eragrostis curvula]